MLRIGTSGWHYKDWRERFYPTKMPAREYLRFYATRFDTVELNGVFYRLPTEEAVQEWRRSTPDRFLFAYKGSRFITHMKKLQESQGAVDAMMKRAELLNEKLGVILWQLPPFFKVDTARLDNFLGGLPSGFRYTVEFRHSSWYIPEVLQLLKHHRVALCLHDMKGSISPIEVTAPFVYVRFHGTGEKKYHGGYSLPQLSMWSKHLRRWLREKKDVFAYFNNDFYGMAIKDAEQLRKLLDQ